MTHKYQEPRAFTKRMKELNYTAQQLAERLQTARSTVYKWKTGTHAIPAPVAELMEHIPPLPSAGTSVRVRRKK